MCMNCAVQMGKHIYTNQVEECCVCLENKIMLILNCNHKVCNDCWYHITNYEIEYDEDGFQNEKQKPLCPLCRNCSDWNSK